MTTTNRRNFLGKGAAAAAVTAVTAVPVKAQIASPTKRVIYRDGKKPAKPSTRMSGTVAYGNLIFISAVGYHKEGDIKVHTKAGENEVGGYEVYRRILPEEEYDRPLNPKPVAAVSYVDVGAPYGTPLVYTVRADIRIEDYNCGEPHRDLSSVAGVRRP